MIARFMESNQAGNDSLSYHALQIGSGTVAGSTVCARSASGSVAGSAERPICVRLLEMSEHPNAILIRELFAAFRVRDIQAIRSAISETAVWHFPGKTGKLAGAHVGHAGIFEFLVRVSDLTGGTFELDLEEVLANDRWAVAFFRGRARRHGRELDNPTCLKVCVQNGRTTEVWEFVWDLYAVDEFWS